MSMLRASGWEPKDTHHKRWQCGHCNLVVEIPPEHDRPDLYGAAIMFIRDHRFGHIADAFTEGSDEAIMGLCEDKPSGFDPIEFNGRRYVAFPTDLPRVLGDDGTRAVGPYPQPVTSDDVAPAIEMADAIVRGRA